MFGKEARDATTAIKTIEQNVRSWVEDAVQRAMNDTNEALRKARSVQQLTTEIETLKIEKSRREEEFARKEREIEHKVGLEKQRQEQELTLSKREATVTVREEALKADRERFVEQLKFHDDRFTQEVGYLKQMLGEVLQRVPEVKVNMEGTTNGRAVRK